MGEGVSLSAAAGAEAGGKTGAVSRLEVDAARRLATARGLLRRLEDRAAGDHPVVEPGADARVLPVVAPLASLLPAGGLRRGTTVAVTGTAGATSLVLALLAAASAAGAWVGVIGRPDLGLVAAAEAGVALERVALVPYPGADLVAVAAALLDGLDVVVLAGRLLHGSDRARLAARARQRGAVLLPLGPWPGAEVELGCVQAKWRGAGGVAEGGVGRLRTRRVQVQVRGRGAVGGGSSARLLLPGQAGVPAVDVIADGTVDAGRHVVGGAIESREAG